LFEGACLHHRAPARAAGQGPLVHARPACAEPPGPCQFKPPLRATALQNAPPARALERATLEEARSGSKADVSRLQALWLQALRILACP
jgi:hypothetical protein